MREKVSKLKLYIAIIKTALKGKYGTISLILINLYFVILGIIVTIHFLINLLKTII